MVFPNGILKPGPMKWEFNQVQLQVKACKLSCTAFHVTNTKHRNTEKRYQRFFFISVHYTGKNADKQTQ